MSNNFSETSLKEHRHLFKALFKSFYLLRTIRRRPWVERINGPKVPAPFGRHERMRASHDLRRQRRAQPPETSIMTRAKDKRRKCTSLSVEQSFVKPY